MPSFKSVANCMLFKEEADFEMDSGLFTGRYHILVTWYWICTGLPCSSLPKLTRVPMYRS